MEVGKVALNNNISVRKTPSFTANPIRNAADLLTDPAIEKYLTKLRKEQQVEQQVGQQVEKQVEQLKWWEKLFRLVNPNVKHVVLDQDGEELTGVTFEHVKNGGFSRIRSDKQKGILYRVSLKNNKPFCIVKNYCDKEGIVRRSRVLSNDGYNYTVYNSNDRAVMIIRDPKTGRLESIDTEVYDSNGNAIKHSTPSGIVRNGIISYFQTPKVFFTDDGKLRGSIRVDKSTIYTFEKRNRIRQFFRDLKSSRSFFKCLTSKGRIGCCKEVNGKTVAETDLPDSVQTINDVLGFNLKDLILYPNKNNNDHRLLCKHL